MHPGDGMPYEISFKKAVTVADPEIYINDCCWGGDVVQAQLLPLIEGQYDDVEANQEDWGWLIWFRSGNVHLQINITTDSKDEFRIHLVSLRKHKKFLFTREEIVDLPELES